MPRGLHLLPRRIQNGCAPGAASPDYAVRSGAKLAREGVTGVSEFIFLSTSIQIGGIQRSRSAFVSHSCGLFIADRPRNFCALRSNADRLLPTRRGRSPSGAISTGTI